MRSIIRETARYWADPKVKWYKTVQHGFCGIASDLCGWLYPSRLWPGLSGYGPTPTKELMRLAREGKIQHGNHPVLSWMVDNIHVRVDPAGNIKPDKEKSTEKIDGVVAMIMALDRVLRCGIEDTCSSVYDERGLILF